MIALIPSDGWCAGAEDLHAAAVANVDGRIVTRRALESAVGNVEARADLEGRELTNARKKQIRKDVLEQLIRRQLAYQESIRQGIVVTPEDITRRQQQMQQLYESPQAYAEAVAASDMTDADIQAEVEKDIAIEKLLRREVADRVSVTDADARYYYQANPHLFDMPEKVRVRHIMVALSPEADAHTETAARKKIADIRKKLLAGEDFTSLAIAFSEAPDSEQGGDTGFFHRGQKVEAFSEAAFALSPGEVSDVVRTDQGLHIIKLIERQPAARIAFETVRDELIHQLRQQRVRRQVAAYLMRLRENADVTVYGR